MLSTGSMIKHKIWLFLRRLKQSGIWFWLNISLVAINLAGVIFLTNKYNIVGMLFCSAVAYIEWKKDNIRLAK